LIVPYPAKRDRIRELFSSLASFLFQMRACSFARQLKDRDLGIHQVGMHCESNQLSETSEIHLAQDLIAIALDDSLRDVQGRRHLLVAPAFGVQLHHLHLALGEGISPRSSQSTH
jgi:hypothetical protein